MNNHKKQSGFTLIEMIIYLAIVSMMLVSTSYLIIDIVGGQSKNYANQDVNQNLRFITNQIDKDIKAASDIGSLSASQLVLTMPGDDITYNFETASLTISRQVGLNTKVDLNSNRVNVTGNFTDQSYGSRSKNVGISMELNYKNPNNLSDLQASSSAAWSVEVRGRK